MDDTDLLHAWLSRPLGQSLKEFAAAVGIGYDALRQRRSRNPALKRSMDDQEATKDDASDPELSFDRAFEGADEEAEKLNIPAWTVKFVRGWLACGSRVDALDHLERTWFDVRLAMKQHAPFASMYAEAEEIIREATSVNAEDNLGAAARRGDGASVRKWLETHDPRYAKRIHITPDAPKAMPPALASEVARALLTGGTE